MKIDHINISVSDLEKSKRFYVDLLGFEVEDETYLEDQAIDKVVGLQGVKADYIRLGYPDNQTKLELIKYHEPKGDAYEKIDQPNQIGLRHMAFEVKNIHEVYPRLLNAGVEFFSEVQTRGKKSLVYFYGPDREILELAEYHE